MQHGVFSCSGIKTPPLTEIQVHYITEWGHKLIEKAAFFEFVASEEEM